MAFRSSAVSSNERLQCSVRGCQKRRVGIGRWCSEHTYYAKSQGAPRQHPLRPEVLRLYELQANRYFRKHHDPGDAQHRLGEHSRTSPQIAAALAEANDLLSLGREAEPFQYEGRRWHAPGTLKGQATSPEWYAWRELHRLCHPPPTADRRALAGKAAAGRTIPRRRPEPVQPIEVLKAVLPVFLMSEIDPPCFADDDALTFALARRVFELRPYAITRASHDRKGRMETTVRVPGAKALRYFGQRIRDHLGLWLFNALATIREEEKARADRRAALRVNATAPQAQPKRRQQPKPVAQQVQASSCDSSVDVEMTPTPDARGGPSAQPPAVGPSPAEVSEAFKKFLARS